MFDDVKQEPEDMFEQTDKVAPQVTAPTDQPPVPPSAPVAQDRMNEVVASGGGVPWKMIVLIVGIIVIVVASFFLSMKILGSKTPVTPEPPTAVMVDEKTVVKEVKEEVVEEIIEEEVVKEPVSSLDTDKDGLTDEEEKEFGTSSRSADTDGDGLFDREEVYTWETDPLNPDTDGDGFLDGEEVKGGYNPSGEGLLREAPSESS